MWNGREKRVVHSLRRLLVTLRGSPRPASVAPCFSPPAPRFSVFCPISIAHGIKTQTIPSLPHIFLHALVIVLVEHVDLNELHFNVKVNASATSVAAQPYSSGMNLSIEANYGFTT